MHPVSAGVRIKVVGGVFSGCVGVTTDAGKKMPEEARRCHVFLDKYPKADWWGLSWGQVEPETLRLTSEEEPPFQYKHHDGEPPCECAIPTILIPYLRECNNCKRVIPKK